MDKMEVKLLLGRPTFNLRIWWLRVRAAPGAPSFLTDPLRTCMSILSRLRKPNLLQRIWEKILSQVSYKQWVLLIAKGAESEIQAWNSFTPLTPPSDRIWADPFVWMHQGNYFIFYEERFYASNRGHIA